MSGHSVARVAILTSLFLACKALRPVRLVGTADENALITIVLSSGGM